MTGDVASATSHRAQAVTRRSVSPAVSDGRSGTPPVVGAKRAAQAKTDAAETAKRRKTSGSYSDGDSEGEPDTGLGEDDQSGSGSESDEGSSREASVVVTGKRRKTKRSEYNDAGEEVFCKCRDVWDGVSFMIQCDSCGEWYHGDCVGIHPAEGKDMPTYECEACLKLFREREKFANEREKGSKEDESHHAPKKGNVEKRKSADASPKAHAASKAGAKPVSKTSSRPSKSASSAAPEAPKVQDPWKGDIPDKTENQLRLKARKGFETLFAEFFPASDSPTPPANASGSAVPVPLDPVGYAALLETHMYISLRDPVTYQPSEKYKAQYRSLRLNLKDASNMTLRSRILKGELLPETLAVLSSDQMASEEAMRLAEEVRKKALKESVLKAESDRSSMIRKTHKGEEIIVPTDIQPLSIPAGPSLRGDRPRDKADGELAGSLNDDEHPASPGLLKLTDSGGQQSFDNLLAQLDGRRTSFGTGLEGSPRESGRSSANLSPPHSPGPGSPLLAYGEVTEPALRAEHDPVIWRGSLQMPSVAGFRCQARQVAGRRLADAVDGHHLTLPNISWSDVLRETLQVDGRVGHDKVVDYLVQQTYSTSKEVVVLQFENADDLLPEGAAAFSDFDKAEYKTLLEYFHSRSRFGVIGQDSRTLLAKDMYLVPVKRDQSLPEFFEFIGASSIKDGVVRDHDVIFGVTVLLKQNAANSAKAKAAKEFEMAQEEAEAAREAEDALISVAAAIGTWDAPAQMPPASMPMPIQPAQPSFGMLPGTTAAVGDPLAGLTNVNLSNLLNQIQSLNSNTGGPAQAWSAPAQPVSVPKDPRLARQQQQQQQQQPAPPTSAVLDPSAALGNLIGAGFGQAGQPGPYGVWPNQNSTGYPSEQPAPNQYPNSGAQGYGNRSPSGGSGQSYRNGGNSRGN